MMGRPTIDRLPTPPADRAGWPWAEETPPLPEKMPDGHPWPRISIVTPSFNQGQFIEETIRSVLLQGYPNLEYIIIDGGSKDGTVEIIRKYEPWLTYWVSEPDRGQSHAINKGLARCTGEIFNWINSDDLLCPGALVAIAQAWQRAPGSVLAAPVVNFDEKCQETLILQRNLSAKGFAFFAEAARLGMKWHQPGLFLPLPLVQAAGGVVENLQYTMDRVLMMYVLQRADVIYFDTPVVRFRLHPESKTRNHDRLFALEAAAAMVDCPFGHSLGSKREFRKEYALTMLRTAADPARSSPWNRLKLLLEASITAPWTTCSHILCNPWYLRRICEGVLQDLRSVRIPSLRPASQNSISQPNGAPRCQDR